MINNRRVLAIIPARGGSKGLPKKNIKNLAGKPLVAWPISAALGCKEVDKVIVSTDCGEIAKIAEKWGAEVPFLRPDDLSGDNASSMDVVMHVIEELEDQREHFDYVVMLEPTSPLTESEDLSQALKLLTESSINADAIALQPFRSILLQVSVNFTSLQSTFFKASAIQTHASFPISLFLVAFNSRQVNVQFEFSNAAAIVSHPSSIDSLSIASVVRN